MIRALGDDFLCGSDSAKALHGGERCCVPLGAVSDAAVLQKGHLVVQVASGSDARLHALVGEGAPNEEVGDAEGTQNVVDVGAVWRAGGGCGDGRRREG